jgi:hypothetical protein
MQSEKFDNLFDGRVPYVGFDKINLLKANEISHEDQAKLMKQGLGDLFRHPSMQILSSSIVKEKVDLALEENDPFKASLFRLKFVGYKTPLDRLNRVPKSFYFKVKFWLKEEKQTEYLSCH